MGIFLGILQNMWREFTMFEMFGQSFIIRSFIVGLLISVSAALVGTPLVLRRNAMIGDGLSHVGFGAFALATVLNLAPLEFALPAVIFMSFLILRLTGQSKVQPDAAIAMMSAGALALGTFVISITKGVNTDINNYLFGSILSISNEDLILGIIFSIMMIGIFVICYNKIFALTFDEEFAKSVGVKTDLYNVIFAILCSVVVVLGMRLMGALLISSLIIFPTMSAMQIVKTFKKVTITSVLISIICFVLGMFISYNLSTPTGSTIVLVNLLVFLFCRILR